MRINRQSLVGAIAAAGLALIVVTGTPAIASVVETSEPTSDAPIVEDPAEPPVEGPGTPPGPGQPPVNDGPAVPAWSAEAPVDQSGPARG